MSSAKKKSSSNYEELNDIEKKRTKVESRLSFSSNTSSNDFSFNDKFDNLVLENSSHLVLLLPRIKLDGSDYTLECKSLILRHTLTAPSLTELSNYIGEKTSAEFEQFDDKQKEVYSKKVKACSKDFKRLNLVNITKTATVGSVIGEERANRIDRNKIAKYIHDTYVSYVFAKVEEETDILLVL